MSDVVIAVIGVVVSGAIRSVAVVRLSGNCYSSLIGVGSIIMFYNIFFFLLYARLATVASC